MLRTEFLKTKKCEICNNNFDSFSEHSEYRLFLKHLKNKHNISYEDYYVKYYLNGIIPKCECGCDKKPNFYKGDFNKYYGDHKNKTLPKNSSIIKIKKQLKIVNNLENRLKKLNLSILDIENAWNNFKNMDKSMQMLSKELSIDFRTLKSYWIELKFIENKEVFKRLTLKSKTKWLNKIVEPDNDKKEYLKSLIPSIHKYLENRNKVTIDEIVKYFKLDINKNYFCLFLDDQLNNSEISKIKFFKSSNIEIEFFNVLRFYFGNSITHSFELEHKIFDFKLGKKILIELDGEYWHGSEYSIKNDKLKNEIALRNGYVLIRISDKKVKELDNLIKIKKLYDKFK
jgi:very-short-patch-repair endonuclease